MMSAFQILSGKDAKDPPNGTTNPPPDFGSLLLESRKITADISRHDGIQPLHKTPKELEAESESFGRRAGPGAGYEVFGAEQQSQHNALNFFASRNYDTERAMQGIEALEQQPTGVDQIMGGGAGAEDLEAYLNDYHNIVVRNAIAETKQAAEESAVLKLLQWERSDWRHAKQQLTQKMGIRREQFTRADAAPRSTVLAITPSGPSLMDIVTTSSRGADTGDQSTRSQLANEMRVYWDEVKKLNIADKGRDSNIVDFVKNFMDAVEGLIKPGITSGPAIAHARLWYLLGEMFKADTGNLRDEGERAKNRCKGAIEYLELLFWDAIKRRAVTMKDKMIQLTEKRGMCREVLMHVALEYEALGGESSTSEREARVCGQPLWPQVYFCLRSGKRREAMYAVQAALDEGCPDTCLQPVRELLDESRSDKRRATEKVRSVYLENQSPPPLPMSLRYKLVTLNLLLGEDHKKTEKLMGTVEDYMWFKLNFVTAATRGYGLQNLQREVEAYGANHFDRDGRTPLTYCSVLLMCQLPGASLEHMMRAGLVMQAVHLGIALEKGRLLGSTQEDLAHGAARDEQNKHDGLVKAECASPLLHDIIIEYTKGWMTSDPQVVVHYLFRLRDEGFPPPEGTINGLGGRVFMEECTELLLSTDLIDALAGNKHAPNVPRSKGELDKLLPENKVNAILEDAAEEAERQRDVQTALRLYVLVGKLTEAIQLINRNLVEFVNQPADNSERQGLISLATNVRDTLGGTQGRGVMGLEDTVGMNELKYMNDLIRIALFFNCSADGRAEEALDIVYRQLNMLPTPGERVSITPYDEVPNGIKPIFPQILVRVMQCLCAHYAETRRRWNAQGQQQLSDLRERAKQLLTYAAELRVPQDAIGKLSRMEVTMM